MNKNSTQSEVSTGNVVFLDLIDYYYFHCFPNLTGTIYNVIVICWKTLKMVKNKSLILYMITCKNIINYLDREIPEFNELEYQNFREYKSIYINQFAGFYVKNCNPNLIRKMVTFIDEMSVSTDPDVQTILDDFIITLYDIHVERNRDIGDLYKRLSKKSKVIYDDNINRWMNG